MFGEGRAIKKVENKLGKKIYKKSQNDVKLLINTIADISEKLLKEGMGFLYFTFYLLPKIHKRLGNVLGRTIISYCRYHNENVSLFLDFPLKTTNTAKKAKDTNDFLK